VRHTGFAVLFGVSVVLAAGPASGAPGIAPANVDPQPSLTPTPARGMFLVARRGLPDPNFSGTVVLLIHHDAAGTLGVVVNRRTSMTLGELAPYLDGVDDVAHAVFVGGPVALERLVFLARGAGDQGAGKPVIEGVYFSADRTVLEDLLRSATPQRALRVYVGHAGWAAGQLAYELERGDWHLAEGDAEAVFDAAPEEVWRSLIRRFEPGGILVMNRPASDVLRRP
jgi:putative transcriptional regulator